MSSADLLQETNRVMVICNSCRYCEGFCAVFPAMERRRVFTAPDLKYLANLCHNCRGCYYACQYAPPHEFDVNVPRTLAELRLETYRRFARPRSLSGLFRQSAPAYALITALCIVVVFLLAHLTSGRSAVLSVHTGAGAFYEVLPYGLIVFPFSALALLILAALVRGMGVFWRESGGRPSEIFDPSAHRRALWDALRLKYLDGGGQGCNYPDERFSMVRRWYHHLVFYGFMLCFAATSLAAVYEHFLDKSSPFPLWSWPVALGTTGGLALLVGTAGLLDLKRRMDPEPASPQTFGMDVGFTLLLFLTAATGLLLLAIRETPAMGTLLTVHLGLVAGLFVTMPYGKFVHAVYRYTALVRNAIEENREARARKA